MSDYGTGQQEIRQPLNFQVLFRAIIINTKIFQMVFVLANLFNKSARKTRTLFITQKR